MSDNSLVSYDRQTVDAPNPIARFAHRSRMRRAIRIVETVTPSSGTVVDFGAGTGRFLHELGKRGGERTLYAFEPFMHVQYPDITRITEMSELQPASVDTLTAFEVCEHLYYHELTAFIGNARRVLKRSGHMVLSVPIMLGPVVGLKEINRMILFRRKSEYSLGEIARATIALPVPRPQNPRPTHKGFDFRQLKRALATVFTIDQEIYSPFARLPWLINSQVFFVATLFNGVES
jgi:2-polyprenyl-3-methyl-5-hydroxy-6-metoxy-1,4-benzoquinol methylase